MNAATVTGGVAVQAAVTGAVSSAAVAAGEVFPAAGVTGAVVIASPDRVRDEVAGKICDEAGNPLT